MDMRVLIVCSGNADGFVFEINQAFVCEQMKAVSKCDESVIFDTFFLSSKGVRGYLNQLKLLKLKIEEFHPDLIHAHYGLSGLFANLQRQVPVVTTYHGSDINDKKSMAFSKISVLLSKHNVFVSSKLARKAKASRKCSIIPCGVTMDDYPYVDKVEARKLMGIDACDRIVLFSSAFANVVKNAPLAKAAVEQLDGVKMIELKGYNRGQVNLLLHAADVALMTSFTEGSPQFIKEAMAAGCPIVSVDVGDVKDVVGDTEGCFIAERDPKDIAVKIESAIEFGKRTNGRSKIENYSNEVVANKIVDIYKSIKK